MTLERVVRPFQNDDVFTARRLAPSQPSVPSPDDVVVTWTGSVQAKWSEEPLGTLNFEAVWKEESRVSEKVRVENPDDEEQFVMVERIKRLVLKNEQTGEQMKFDMNWPT